MSPVLRRGIGAADIEVVAGEPIAFRVTNLGALEGTWTIAALDSLGNIDGDVDVDGDDLTVGWDECTARMVDGPWALYRNGIWKMGGHLLAAVPGDPSEPVVVQVDDDGQTIDVTLTLVDGTVPGGEGGGAVVVALLVEDADLSGGGFTELTANGLGTIPRGSLVGAVAAVREGDDITHVWTITASGPCTQGAAVAAGDLISAYAEGIVAEARSLDGGATVVALIVSPTAAEVAAAVAPVQAEVDVVEIEVAGHGAALDNLGNASQKPFAAWMHRGDLTQDGVTDWLEQDPADMGLEAAEGTTYEGMPVLRPTAATISGATPPADINSVVFLNHQTDVDHNGAYEIFSSAASIGYVQADVDPGGILRTTFGWDDLTDIGVYCIRTVTWNWGWRHTATGIGYEQLRAGSTFQVGGGSNAGDWVTTVNGIRGVTDPGDVADPSAIPAAQATAYEPGVTVADALDGIPAQIAALVDSAPATLDTLNELAAALGDDPNFATTVTNALAGKQPIDADLTAIAALTTTAIGRSLLAIADAAAGRTVLGLATVAATGAYADLTGEPGVSYRKIKTGTTARNSDVLTVDPDLQQTSVPAGSYVIRAGLPVTGGNNTPDVKVAITGGTAVFDVFGASASVTTFPNAPVLHLGHSTGTPVASGTGAGGSYVQIFGTCVLASPATVSVDWAQNVDTVGQNTTVLAGAFLTIDPVT